MPIMIRRLIPFAFAMLLTLATAAGASAARPHGFPGQSLGNRGEDVRAIQGFLQAHDIDAPTDGIFGTSTRAAVKAFRSAEGLSAHGQVDDKTWAKLIVSLAPGSTGDAVIVLQRQLNAKRKAGLSVNGTFDVATRKAVNAFRAHVGMPRTGKVGPVTWRRLISHLELPRFKANDLCDYQVGNGAADWGTGAAIGQLEAAGRAFATKGHGRIAVGDVSLEHGGDIPLHHTHEVGLDVDIRAVRDAGDQCRWGVNWRWSTYDRSATRKLINTVRATAPGHVKLIYFNDPVLIREGLTTWYAGHDDHLHIRYCEKDYPIARYRC
jgi:peptidoglycan hydrolase-like protein with peptidoglycan-binding domain